MTARDILSTYYVSIPRVQLLYVLGFSVAATTYFVVFQKRTERASLRGLLTYMFPGQLYTGTSSRIDIWNYFLNLAFIGPIVALTGSLILGESVRAFLVAHFGDEPVRLQLTWLVVAVQSAAVYLSGELGSYVWHYMTHRIPVLWHFHRAHHSAEALTPFTRSRFHPLDEVLSVATRALFGAAGTGCMLYATGTQLSPTTTAIVALIMSFWTIVSPLFHSHIPISFGPLNYLLLAPVMHQLHHSAEPRHRDKNLGGTILIYDWLFGTLYVPKSGEHYRLGLNETEIGENNPYKCLRDIYVRPLRDLWKSVASRRAFKEGPKNWS
jgi:sterol desaturase/sphingolipid hydroxylase (fatty acid hydroxylase superfamily)